MAISILDHYAPPFADLQEAERHLIALQLEFAVSRLTYWNIGGRGTPRAAIWLTTDREEKPDAAHDLQRTDPVFLLSFARLLPTDYDAIHRLEGRATAGPRNGAPTMHGIAIPIRDETTGDSLFNVHLECSAAEWRRRRNVLARDFMVVGHVFHVMMRDVIQGAEPLQALPHLSPREIDVMRLAAQGYSAKQTAMKLGISPHSVRVHLTLARRRLKARNTAEAVALALSRGLLI